MDYPEFVKVKGKKYKINTDFRVAIRCDKIARDTSIGDYERGLGIICVLFEERALYDARNDLEVHSKLLELAQKYLSCEKELDMEQMKEPDMDFVKDEGYIKSSFKYDYKYNPYELECLHWYEFFNDLCNLSNSEFGNCCVLSNVRNLRNFDLSQIKDSKERQKIKDAQDMVALKKKKKKKREFTDEEVRNANNFYEKMGIGKE